MAATSLSALPAYSVEPSEPHVLDGLVPFHLPNRSPALPPLYRYVAGRHPRLANRTIETGEVYVYLVDSSPKGRAAFRKIVACLEIPCGMIDQPGGNQELEGLLALDAGDAVFVRDNETGGDPNEDALQVLIGTNDQDIAMVSKRTALAKSRDDILGPRESRDSRRVWFEEQGRAKDIGDGTRCYGLSNMFERAWNSTAPPAALKVVEGRLDIVQLAVKELVRSGMDYNMATWTRMAPESLQKTLEAYAELINAPRIGCQNNYMWSSCQLNVAEPQRVSAEQSLGVTNGRFGDSHTDELDTPTHLSCATVLSDLPDAPGWEPGRMHFLSIGCYTVLTPFKQFFFTGRQKHGSSRPLVPSGHRIPKWACRAMLISYPNQAITLGTVKRCFTVEPGKKDAPIFLTPHMFAGPREHPVDGHYTTHATMAQDGTTVMDDASLVNWHGRSNLSWSHWNMSFLPPHLRVEIDANKFLEAFTYVNDKNERVHLEPWSMAPTSDVNNPYDANHVEVQASVLHTLYNRMAKGIPDVGPSPFNGNYLTVRGTRTRPESLRPSARRLDILPPYDEHFTEPLPPRNAPPKRRRSPRNATTTDDADDPGVGVGVKRKHPVPDRVDEHRYDLRPSVRRDNTPDISTPPLSPLTLELVDSALDTVGDNTLAPPSSDRSSVDINMLCASTASAPPVECLLQTATPTLSPSFADSSTCDLRTDGPSAAPLSLDMLDTAYERPQSAAIRVACIGKGETNTERDARLQYLRNWCNGLNGSALESLLEEVVFSARHVHLMRFDTLSWSTSTLDRFQTVIEPFRMVPDELSEYFSVFSVAKNQSVGSSVWAGILRQRIILHEHRVARSVMDIEEVLCPEIFTRGTFMQDPQNWIEYLLRDIRIKLVIRYKENITLSSRSYIHTGWLPDVVYVEPEWLRKDRIWSGSRPSNEEFSRRAAVYLGRVLRTWFELPNSYLTKGRAQLVDVLVSKFGPGVLYLPTVWDIHRDMPRQLYRNPPWDYNTNQLNKDKPYDPSSMDDFIRMIDSVSGNVPATCSALERACTSFLRLMQAYVQQTKPTQSDDAVMSSVCHTAGGAYDRRRNVVEMIHDTSLVLRHMDGDTLLTSATAAQQAMLDAPDARICAREYAPSRALMSNNVDRAFMRSREGFFTAMVFRNIQFNSPAFLSCPAWIAKYKFVSLADWNDYIEQLKTYFHDQPEEFFCNPRALGQPIVERTIDQAPHFKHVSEVCDWPDDWPVSFSDMYRRLQDIKGSLKLPGCGPLGLYLLCADMVYYDMVELPSTDDIAQVILDLRMGALAGLETLGYLGLHGNHSTPASSYSVDQVRVAVEEFYGDTQLLLMSNGLVDTYLTTIDVEHVLCKFSRLWNMKLYRQRPM